MDGTDDNTINLHTDSSVRPYAFLWSDNSGIPHSTNMNIDSDKARDWTNERFINIDETSQTLSIN